MGIPDWTLSTGCLLVRSCGCLWGCGWTFSWVVESLQQLGPQMWLPPSGRQIFVTTAFCRFSRSCLWAFFHLGTIGALWHKIVCALLLLLARGYECTCKKWDWWNRSIACWVCTGGFQCRLARYGHYLDSLLPELYKAKFKINQQRYLFIRGVRKKSGLASELITHVVEEIE